MTQLDLNEIVDLAMKDPRISGCIVSNLHGDQSAERHRGQETLSLSWYDRGDCRRCTIVAEERSAKMVAQVDLGENATLRVDAFRPCRITVAHEEGFLSLVLL